MTLLGRMMIELPLDIRLTRVVFYGTLLGCPCDAVVLAAAMACKDPFTSPTQKVIKKKDKFLESLERSFLARWEFDNGNYSEPLMILNLYKSWLEFSVKSRDLVSTTRNQFCYAHAVVYKRLMLLENVVAEIMEKMTRIIPKGTDYYEKVIFLPYKILII